MQRLFVDTSAWFAYANRKDRGHTAVRTAIAGFDGRLVTSNFIFNETLSLCLYRLGHAAAERVGAVLLDPDTIDLIRVTPEDEQSCALYIVSESGKIEPSKKADLLKSKRSTASGAEYIIIFKARRDFPPGAAFAINCPILIQAQH